MIIESRKGLEAFSRQGAPLRHKSTCVPKKCSGGPAESQSWIMQNSFVKAWHWCASAPRPTTFVSHAKQHTISATIIINTTPTFMLYRSGFRLNSVVELARPHRSRALLVHWKRARGRGCRARSSSHTTPKKQTVDY
jgi:hypothetical protein